MSVFNHNVVFRFDFRLGARDFGFGRRFGRGGSAGALLLSEAVLARFLVIVTRLRGSVVRPRRHVKMLRGGGVGKEIADKESGGEESVTVRNVE